MNFENSADSNEIIAYAPISLYSKDSIFKCVYWYGDKYNVKVSLIEVSAFKISLRPLNGEEFPSNKSKDILQKLERDLIDFNLRDIVTKETQNIRDLLIAKAFSNGELDEMPPGELSDPVGFDVNEIKND